MPELVEILGKLRDYGEADFEKTILQVVYADFVNKKTHFEKSGSVEESLDLAVTENSIDTKIYSKKIIFYEEVIRLLGELMDKLIINVPIVRERGR